MNFADVAINRDIPQTFIYEIPDRLRDHLKMGQLVHVPFRTGQESGIVIRIHAEKPSFTTKPILDILDPLPAISPIHRHLAEWMARETVAAIGHCLWMMLPPGFAPRSDMSYTLVDEHAQPENSQEEQILAALKRRGNRLSGLALTSALGKRNWDKTMKELLRREVVTAQASLAPPLAQPKTIRQVILNIPEDQISDAAWQVGRDTHKSNVLEALMLSPRWMEADLLAYTGVPKNILSELAKEGFFSVEDFRVEARMTPKRLKEKLLDMRKVLPYLEILNTLAANQGAMSYRELMKQVSATPGQLSKLQEMDYIVLGESEVWRNSLGQKTFLPSQIPDLTPEQADIWGHICQSMDDENKSEVFLLHGVTGSGKTEIYLRAVEHILAQGRQAIVLVPEIALTAQMLQRFASRFEGKVALVHSSLSAGERYDTWRRARKGLIQVVIGARSAIFTPLPDVGLIVLDEEHDDSYKHSPPMQNPYYHTREVAIEYMRQNRGTLILGSATPDIKSYFNAQQGNYKLLELPNRVIAHREQIELLTQEFHLTESRYHPVQGTDVTSLALPYVQIVDMRQELRVGNASIFSRFLQVALNEVLGLKQQAILFLNRRGAATYVFCRDCGYVARCPRCDTTLTHHRDEDHLRCHGCGHKEPNPYACPECQSLKIKHFGAGTQQIENHLREEYPGARVLRWDQDTASNHLEHERIFKAFLNHEADILIGTQMIAKGLDLPKVTLVGIVSADMGLGLPDYRAAENTFQLLTQVAGRAGRSPLGGRVVLQTYHPNHYAILAASNHDYQTFYRQEIGYRRDLHWSPFIRVARLLFQGTDPEKVQKEAERVAARLEERLAAQEFTASSLIGPVPCFFAKHDNNYRWHILIRTTDPVALLTGFDLGPHCILDIDPVNIL